MSIDVRYSGPIFSASRTAAAMKRIDNEAEGDIADAVYAEVMSNLRRSIRNPRPYYWRQVTISSYGDRKVVHDRGVVYGPWLEGVGSRNQTTRFKGYASFRRAAATVEARAGAMGQRAVGRHIGELGG